MTTRSAIAIAALLAALGLAACGGSSPAKTTSSETGSGSAAASSKKHVKLAMELILTGQSFGVQLKEGIEAFEKEDGATEIEIQGPPGVDPELAQQQAVNLLSKEPEAMGYAPFPPELWTRTAKEITERVPKTLVFNERPAAVYKDAAAAPAKLFVGTADRTLAREATKKLIELAKISPSATGDAIIGQCVPQEVGVLAMRTEGVKEVLSEMLPKVTPVVFNSKESSQESVNAWTTELSDHPNPVLAIGVCTEDGGSLNKVKEAHGYKFPAGAMDLEPGTEAGLRNGNILDDVAVSWWMQGYAAARLLAEAARGVRLPEGFVNSGTYMFTKQNVSQLSERLNEPERFFKPMVEQIFGHGPVKAEPLEAAYK